MTEYGCSVCGYTSQLKQHVKDHLSRKRSCGPGIKELIEIPIEIICQYCNKKFSTKKTLDFHIKNNCKHKDDAKDAKIKELEKELRESRKVTINDNSTNTYNIFIVNNYEDTDLSKLTDKTYNKIIRDSDEAYQIIPRLIKEIHFNPNIPENHNIVLSNRNKNNKHLQVYRNKHWEIEKKDNEIDNLISDKETNLSDWVAEKGEKYPEAKEKFNEYLEQKYDDVDTVKLVKENVELVLYNNRHMIKSS
jgi:ElaB/YqjD/DUF883 family membrane-anchored ribosome-binding protein